jgi:ubiquinone/menaquinone biosynthesis C-methylase UbiE
MTNFSEHTEWQAKHYDENPPLNPFEELLRKIGFNKIIRPKDLATRQYLEACNPTESTEVLDLGCASGLLLQRIQLSYKARGTGVDVSSNLIEKAKSVNPENTYLIADASKLPFPDNSFDIVTSFDNLEHIKEYQEVLKEIVRVLKPNGKLILNTINKHNKFTFDWLLEKMGSDYHLRRAGHVKELFFDAHEIEKLLKQSGLRNTKIRLFDATFVLTADCILYIFLIIMEKIGRNTNSYSSLGTVSIFLCDWTSKIALPLCEKLDTLIIKKGYSNAFFITGEK